MKGLLITRDYPPNRPGGMSNYYHGLATHAPTGSLLTLTGAAPKQTAAPDQAALVRVPVERAGFPRLLVWTAYALRLIRKERVDLVHCGNASPFKYIALLAKRYFRIPFVIYYHGNDLHALLKRISRSPRAQSATRKVMSQALAIIVNSTYTRTLAESLPGLSADRIIVCPPGVDDAFLDRPFSRHAAGHSPIRLVSAGRLVPRKGFDRVIEAVSLLTRKGYNISYTIVGKGEQEWLRTLAAQCGVADRVNFTGFVKSTLDYQQYLEKADIFVMPSRQENEGCDIEGFGIVFLEAAAMGLPCIASRSGGIGDAVIDGSTGLLVDNPNSPEEIASKIQQLADQPELRARLGRQGLHRVNASFRWNGLVANLWSELEQRLAAGS